MPDSHYSPDTKILVQWKLASELNVIDGVEDAMLTLIKHRIIDFRYDCEKKEVTWQEATE